MQQQAAAGGSRQAAAGGSRRQQAAAGGSRQRVAAVQQVATPGRASPNSLKGGVDGNIGKIVDDAFPREDCRLARIEARGEQLGPPVVAVEIDGDKRHVRAVNARRGQALFLLSLRCRRIDLEAVRGPRREPVAARVEAGAEDDKLLALVMPRHHLVKVARAAVQVAARRVTRVRATSCE